MDLLAPIQVPSPPIEVLIKVYDDFRIDEIYECIPDVAFVLL